MDFTHKEAMKEDIDESVHIPSQQKHVAQIEIKKRIQKLNVESDSEEEHK
jgi:hypothetical protein